MSRSPRWCVATTLGLIATVASHRANATDYNATPTTYTALVPSFRAGDTLHLAAGNYTTLLAISNLNGTAETPIVITGPDSGTPATFLADPVPCCNTIEIRNSSYVVVRSLTIDAHGVDGAFGVSAGGGTTNVVHHITIENCTFLNHNGSQQTDAISTKTPTWGWIIRGNRIVHAGTGLYLGNSDGSSPFVDGLIENNLIENPIGYCMEIKFQAPWPTTTGLPTGPTSTIIRNNVFIKSDEASPDGDRPNLLVGGFPATGPGAQNRYEIYGNVFVHNPRESLFQASGRVTLHDNLFVDVNGTAILLINHDLPLEQAFVYNNTIYSAGTGIHFGSAAPQGDFVVGNLVFAGTPITGTITIQRDNVTDTTANAPAVVANASTTPGMFDLYPRVGSPARAAALDLSAVSQDRDYDRDFNCTPKSTLAFRGAYAGEGTNPGWHVQADVKPAGLCGSTGSDAAVANDAMAPLDGAARDAESTSDGGGNDGGNSHTRAGCGCAIASSRSRDGMGAIFAALSIALFSRRNTRRSRRLPS